MIYDPILRRLSRDLETSDPVQLLGQTLRKHLPFNDDYNRTDAECYEAYRSSAVNSLQAHYGLNMLTANAIVDDAIAVHEKLTGRCHGKDKRDE